MQHAPFRGSPFPVTFCPPLCWWGHQWVHTGDPVEKSRTSDRKEKGVSGTGKGPIPLQEKGGEGDTKWQPQFGAILSVSLSLSLSLSRSLSSWKLTTTSLMGTCVGISSDEALDDLEWLWLTLDRYPTWGHIGSLLCEMAPTHAACHIHLFHYEHEHPKWMRHCLCTCITNCRCSHPENG